MKINLDGTVQGGEFKCPKCGGFRWATSRIVEPFEESTGSCNGDKRRVGKAYVRTYCDFKWTRKDDWQYFVEGEKSYEV